MIVDQSSQNSVSKNFGEKKSSMRRPSRQSSGVTPTQAVTRAMHRAQGAVDDMHLVDERMLLIESEELLFDGNVGVRFGWDRREQVKSAAEFLVKHGDGQVVAARGAARSE